MSSVYPKGKWLYFRLKVNGLWKGVRTDFVVGQEQAARAMLRKIDAQPPLIAGVPKLMRPEEAGAMLDLARSEVLAYARAGTIPSVRISTHSIRFEPRTIEALAQQRKMVRPIQRSQRESVDRNFGDPSLPIGPCVYLVQMSESAPHEIKAGFTSKLEQRLRAFRTVCPRVSVLAAHRVVDGSGRALEAALHLKLSRVGQRIGGEVFSVAPEVAVRELNALAAGACAGGLVQGEE